MSKTLSLLVAVDFSPASERALRVASDLVRKIGASATIAHVRPSSDLRAAIEEDRGDLVRLSPVALARELAAHYRNRLEPLRRRIPGARAVLLRGWPAAALARRAAGRYDIIVIGTRGRGGLRSALLGSTAREVLHRARVPVLMVESRSGSAR